MCYTLAVEEHEIIIPSPQKLKKRNPLMFLIVFILIAGFSFFVYKQFFSGNNAPQKTETTPTPTEYQFPTDTPTQAVSPSPTTEPSVTESPKVSPIDKKTGLNRGDLSVEVQNGSGEALVASKMSDFLKGLGYHVVSIGNADNFNYENITVEVKLSFSKYLNLLKSDLSSQYTVVTASTELSASSSADALVIIGK
ncbi:MAG: LytR C-terminal domain-containing protein [bacterium]|nr:LytR C-terminal domain-containing protein [bacterium]